MFRERIWRNELLKASWRVGASVAPSAKHAISLQARYLSTNAGVAIAWFAAVNRERSTYEYIYRYHICHRQKN